MASGTFHLSGVAFITGAAGIGAATALAFVRSGCTRLALTDIQPLTFTKDAILSINPFAEVLTVQGDVSSASFINSFVSEIKARFSRIDYVVTCAGVLSLLLRSHETPIEEFDRVAGVNWKGSWLASRAAPKCMLELGQEPLDAHPGQKGAVVNVASRVGQVAMPTASPYCASKAAIINMTRADAIDHVQDGIRINCVCPGIIRTQFMTATSELEENTN
ncbi:NAD(P)-binding protein [Hypoxylon trugodes]|uniref:NAD(P)-binding protein n=1 Tax=Hypoxylon trugodes TaxID=326681 RepID=UPI00218E8452|nr:NAD(P)-binding protein [Hypoxylon trugodes]KAI1382747.1 NAD(P)-binding protein [Hypoxylon trugodes]